MLPKAQPEEVGLRPERLRLVDQILQDSIAQGIFPGAVLLVARRGRIVHCVALGAAMETPKRRPMTEDTIFDLASLTKVMVTVPLALMLAERGLWHLRDPLQRFLPQFRGEGREAVTLWHLLTHTSGLPAWTNLFDRLKADKGAFEEWLNGRWPPQIALLFEPGTRVLYSDLGYILLGKAIEAVIGQDLDVLVREWLFQPLDMRDSEFRPPEGRKERIAATEEDPERGGVLVGVVHDENAHALGGVSGHAGLFSTAQDLAIYAQMILQGGCYNGRQVLSPASIQAMISPQTEGLNERRGLGWLLQSPQTLSAGDLLSPRAFGHTGFTGTSLWIDPVHELIVVLLTNRVHPRRERGAHEIERVRARVHNVIVSAIKE